MSLQGATVVRVAQPSPASRAGLREGDRILRCNGTPVTDWADLYSESAGRVLSATIRRGLSEKSIVMRRRPGVEWGITLSDSKPRSCRNRCIFCFVDQQPAGLRDTLMIKDDDVRYSFLQGTYITLTDSQVNEAISRGFNTLHVSVQTTDPILRGKMLGRPEPMPVLAGIDALAEHGVTVQAQIVEVPQWNDGEILERTVTDLYARKNVTILGIVPVGLTRWRSGLTPLRRHNRDEAGFTLSLVHRWQKKAMEERGVPWVFAADEYYLRAIELLPPLEYYDSCTLQANGIGLIAAESLRCSGRTFHGTGIVATGTLAAPLIKELLSGSGYSVIPVQNRLMGADVGVAGLLSAEDVTNSVGNGAIHGGTLFLPSAMFNHHGLTLDGATAADMGKALKMDVVTANAIGDLP